LKRTHGPASGVEMEGAELKAAREAAGLSLEEVSRRTRIPARHLDALERGELHKLPPGPYRSGYARQYRMFLGLPRWHQDSGAPKPAARVPERRPAPAGNHRRDDAEDSIRMPELPPSLRPVLRGVAVGALVLVSLVLLVKVGEEIAGPAGEDLGEVPDQVVELRPTDKVRVQVVADGQISFEGILDPSAKAANDARSQSCRPGCRFTAHDRLEVAIANLSLVTLTYNGRQLKPLGAQSRSRRLVFIDDSAEP
jgi:cytoskeleton protein RodZ